jgi:hypothetical protein
VKGFPYRPGGYGGWPKWWELLLIIAIVVGMQQFLLWVLA